jgi:hypothetical protein
MSDLLGGQDLLGGKRSTGVGAHRKILELDFRSV